jgi:hypothetical protein
MLSARSGNWAIEVPYVLDLRNRTRFSRKETLPNVGMSVTLGLAIVGTQHGQPAHLTTRTENVACAPLEITDILHKVITP